MRQDGTTPKHASATIGGATLPYTAPPAVPAVSPIAPGSAPVTAGPEQTLALAPGSYGSVELLHHSRLVLSAGTYTLGSLRMGPHGVVEVQGPVVVRVATNLEMEHHVQVVLAAGLGPADVSWETLDTNVLIGPDGVFVGSVLAPAAEVEVQHHTMMTGWIQAKRVRVGPYAQVTAPAGSQPVTTSIAYQVNAVNEYTSVGGVARGHDANGNLKDDGSRLFTYDYRNRMVGVARKSDGAAIATYRYDALGRRIEKVVYSQSSPGAVEKATRFFWDAWTLVEEQSAAAVTECTYVGGVGIDEHVQWQRTASHPQGAGTFYLHQDARGTVVAVTDGAGAVVEKTRYDDFGRADHASAIGLAVGFQGRYLDRETGLYEFRHRVYDPATGRFLQRDPIWDPLNVGNQYSFVGNNPVTWSDPSGLLGPLIVVPVILGALFGAGATTYDAATTEDPERLKSYQGMSGAYQGAKNTVAGAAGGAAGAATAAYVAPAGASMGMVLLADAAGGGVGAFTATATSDVLSLQVSSPGTYAQNTATGAVLGPAIGLVARPIADRIAPLAIRAYNWLRGPSDSPTLGSMMSHNALGDIHRSAQGASPAAYIDDMARNWDEALAQRTPFELGLSKTGDHIVTQGQHRVLARMLQLGPAARLSDLPPGSYTTSQLPGWYLGLNRGYPSMLDHYLNLFGVRSLQGAWGALGGLLGSVPGGNPCEK